MQIQEYERRAFVLKYIDGKVKGACVFEETWTNYYSLVFRYAKDTLESGAVNKVIFFDGNNPLPYIKDNLEKHGLLSALDEGKLLYLSKRGNKKLENLIITTNNPVWQELKLLFTQFRPPVAFIVDGLYDFLPYPFDILNVEQIIMELLLLLPESPVLVVSTLPEIETWLSYFLEEDNL
ncbi:hypothetical protein [Hydrogenobacter thermophilus]|uniref:hypothetical protein n=1 Tax=Hydrogenobacter thermophilus TaxID=940 RepID=UPI0030F90307